MLSKEKKLIKVEFLFIPLIFRTALTFYIFNEFKIFGNEFVE